MSLVCTSKCDDSYVQCVSACSDTDCLLDCNRSAVTCADGTIVISLIKKSLHNAEFQRVHVIQIVLKAVRDVKILFASVM